MAQTHADRIKGSVTVSSAGCWLWNKTRARNGYGSFALGGGRNVRAHRASYEAFIGPIPAGLNVCHRCDVRACVNPEHLFLGTQSENVLDAVRKGRHSRANRARGAAHPSAKLTEAHVTDILRHLGRGETKTSIARLFGVSDRTVLLIARGETWKHVTRLEAA